MEDTEKIKELLKTIKIEMKKEKIFLNEEDISNNIRTPEIDRLSSIISTLPIVREKMVELQRKYADNKNIICEGRDMGSVVFPDAEVKFYMDCDIEERARRREKDFKAKGINKSIEEIINELKERDRRDKNRKHSPLIQVQDSIYVDTTSLPIDKEIEIMLGHIKEKMK